MRLMRLLTALMLFSAPAMAQAPLQGGPWVPGHAPQYTDSGSQPVLMDGGGASGGPIGANVGEIGITSRSPTNSYPSANSGTGPFSAHYCMYDAPITNATGYHYLCIDPNAQGGGLLAYGANGGAPILPLYTYVNGVKVTLGSFPAASTSTLGGVLAQAGYNASTGLGSAANLNAADVAQTANNLSDLGNAASSRYNLKTGPCVPVVINGDDTLSVNTNAMQAGINSAISLGYAVCVSGNGTISGQVTIAGPVKVVGQGMYVTFLTLTNSGSTFLITSNNPVEFEDINLYTTLTTSTAFLIQPTSGENAESSFRHLALSGFYTFFNFAASNTFVIDDVDMSNNIVSSIGIIVNNSTADSGDSTIVNSVLYSGSQSNTVGIKWAASGGLRILNNKIIGQAYPIFTAFSGGVGGAQNTADILIIGNSIEGYSECAIALTRASGATGTVKSVLINSNQFATEAGTAVSTVQAIYVPADSTGTWIYGFVSTGNVFAQGGTGLSYYYVLNSMSGFNVSGNTMENHAQCVSACVSIKVYGGSPTYPAINGMAGLNIGTLGPGASNASFGASSLSGSGTSLVAPY